MKLIIGTTELIATNSHVFRYENGKLVLNVEILKSDTTLSIEEIVKLFKENTEDILRIDDANNTTVLGGFRQTVKGSYEEKRVENGDGTASFVEVYKIEAECVSESEFQNARYQARITELEAENVTLKEEMALLNATMLEQILA